MIKATDKYLSTKDFLVTGESFDLLYNHEFEMLVTHPAPSSQHISKYYESKDYISHTDEKSGIVSFIYQKVKNYTLKSKTGYIKSCLGRKGKLLDIGAGTGDFLLQAKSKGWEVKGIEVNELARKNALNKGLILKENLAQVSGDIFDVITLWHVLEHLPNLTQDLKQIDELLKPNGVLIIAVPNFRSFDAKHYKAFWAAFDVPRHLWHFSRNSISRMLPKNFIQKRSKAMIFDSFYISLLSEKYKSGAAFSIKALFVGLYSNLCALRTKEYSSLIYTFQKPNSP